jgi:general secretion pathway protein G
MRKQLGFTLIELLIVVAIIGIIAAVAIPNLLNAVDRGKQKRTMADLRSLAIAIETYQVDEANYPTASDIATLNASLAPVYLRTGIVKDGWGNNFIVEAVTGEYTIGSPGKDGGTLNIVGGPTTNFTDAIIFTSGSFHQWPEGTQQ